MADAAAIEALRAAVEAAPDDHELRLVLARRLLDLGRPTEALAEADGVLDASPAHLAALRVAAGAAAAVGRSDQAVGFRRLLTALGDDGDAPLTSADVPDGTGSAAHEPAAAARAGELASAPGTEPVVRLDDVSGLDAVKRRLELTYLAPRRSPELRAEFRMSLRGGLLLYGPPGCGKAFLARALAGELGAAFRPVALTDVADPLTGQGEQRLHAAFDEARRSAPCAVFLDEVDALGRLPADQHGAGPDAILGLLSELDRVAYYDGLFVLGATSRPWDVDAALHRPGRFDQTLFVPPPDRDARLAVVAGQLADRPIERIDLVAIADASGGCSVTDLARVCETAAQTALARSVRKGALSRITAADLEGALAELSPGPARWLDAARALGHQAGGSEEYGELAAYLRSRRAG